MPKSESSLNDMLHEIRRISEHREKLTEKKIQAIYRTLYDDLDKSIADGFKKYADEEGRLYVSYLDAQNKKAKFLQEIVTNVDSISPKIRKEIMSVVDDTYRTSYKGIVNATKKASASGKFAEVVKDINVEPKVLESALNNNISKLTLPHALEKHRQEIIYQIQQELNIGLMRGDRYERMAKRIESVLVGNGITKGAAGKSMNIVRTESHRNTESGLMDGAIAASEGFEDEDLIYAATWVTRADEAVRPQVRYKTKKGWKTGKSSNGANHMIMEGVTVKAGELFDLKDGAKARAPGESGEARHDCNCRCFLEYNIMTVDEFAKATKQTEEQVRKKYNMYNKKDWSKPNKQVVASNALKAAGDFGDKAVPYSKRGIPIEPRLNGYIKQLPEAGKYISAPAGTFKYNDLAVLTAETGVEYTSLTIGDESFLIRGLEKSTTVPKELQQMLIQNKGTLDCHSHPFIGDLMPSEEDKEFLSVLTWQEESVIIDPQGMASKFTPTGALETFNSKSNHDISYLSELFEGGDFDA